MRLRPVLFSVAHSSVAPGAITPDGLHSEYYVSLRATLAAMRTLAGDVPVEVFDVGPLKPSDYDEEKVNTINRCMPSLAIEIHCNASSNAFASYGEVIHHLGSVEGKRAADCVAMSLFEGFRKAGKNWTSKGGRPNTVEQDKHKMFLLELTKVPSIIVEGLFLSNPDQADWLCGSGDHAGEYGRLVAEGVRKWYYGSRA